MWSWGAPGDAGARAQHVGPKGWGQGVTVGEAVQGYSGRGGAGLQWARWFGWGTGQVGREVTVGEVVQGYSGRGGLGGGRGRVGLRWDPGHGITALQAMAQLRYRYSSDGTATVPLWKPRS